ncbi:hypothetical protein EDD16DRAFT_1008263 [Pisolithus croceorrhizus]|nr:hypothetical protein EDD16DRAFT_1008263 [Pisolithus croceorrhizus]
MIPTSTLAFASTLLPSQIAPVILMRGAVRPATNHKIGIANNAATTENLNVLVPISYRHWTSTVRYISTTRVRERKNGTLTPTVSGCTAFRNITRGQGHSQYTSQRTNYQPKRKCMEISSPSLL